MGIPSSSSHTLIGAIIGVGLANSWLLGHFGSGVNWKKASEVGLSLLISPLIGFFLAALLLLLLKRFFPNPTLHEPPKGDAPPPWWIRGVLILTCSGVSFAHGSNDGQKGIGLIMLILIGLVPMHYAMNMSQEPADFKKVVQATSNIQDVLLDPKMEKAMIAYQAARPAGLMSLFESTAVAAEDAVVDAPPQALLADPELHTTQELVDALQGNLKGKNSVTDLKPDERWKFRTNILMLEHSLTALQNKILPILSEQKAQILGQSRSTLRGTIEYAPTWVLIAVAIALGAGTTVGWKRIVLTVGEKIGKTHLTYSQGASAELVAMTTIGMADFLGMPVSTTHVLSSGVAGTMAANKSGLQMSTIRSIAIAWILTLPVSLVLAGGLFLLFRMFV
jgi:PiT family inorganic phosphate transporter